MSIRVGRGQESTFNLECSDLGDKQQGIDFRYFQAGPGWRKRRVKITEVVSVTSPASTTMVLAHLSGGCRRHSSLQPFREKHKRKP